MEMAAREMTLERPTELLVAAAREGDDAAFSQIVERYRGVVVAYALAVLRNPDEAEDLAQETFIKAYRTLHRLRWNRSWEGWLMQILRNGCRDALRRRKVHRSEPIDPAWIQSDSDPEGLALSAERSQELASAVMALPDQQRLALLMRLESGLSYREIGVALSLPESTVMGRVAAALRTLRRRFGVEGRR